MLYPFFVGNESYWWAGWAGVVFYEKSGEVEREHAAESGPLFEFDGCVLC